MFDKNNTKSIGVTPGYSPIEQYGGIEGYHKVLETRGIKRKPVKVEKFNKIEDTVSLDDNQTAVLGGYETVEQIELKE